MYTHIYIYIRVGRTMLKIPQCTPCQNIHPQAWYTPFLKTLTAKWSWYHHGCGYHSSVLEFLEQRVGEQASSIVFEVPVQPQLQKLEDWRVVARAATVPRPFGCQSIQKRGVPRLGMNILAWCTMRYFQHGSPNTIYMHVPVEKRSTYTNMNLYIYIYIVIYMYVQI